MDMGKLVSFIGMTVGGAIGWYAGIPIGFMTAFVLSCVGTGVGLYVARRAAQQYLVLVFGLLLTLTSRVGAQTPETMKAATELMQTRHEDRLVHDQISASFDVQIQNNPAMAPYRGALQQFAEKYLTWNVIGPSITTAYAQAFSESELKDLIAFYKTPTGQKYAAQTPMLVAKVQSVYLSVLQQHQADLADMIRQQQTDTTHH